MKHEAPGHVFSLVDDNPIVEDCTVSQDIMRNTTCFSLAKGTSISAESYPIATLQLGLDGVSMLHYPDKTQKELQVHKNEAVIKSAGTAIAINADTDTIYVEIALGENVAIGNGIKVDEIISLNSLVPYKDGKIVNRDIVSSGSMKLVIMSFDEGCALSEHAAPAEALIFALEGQGIIGYEGSDYRLKAGENFMFAKNGIHSVKADGKFKMILLLVFE